MSSLTDSSRARRVENKIGVIFGTGGEVGGAVAKELAAQGARVFLSIPRGQLVPTVFAPRCG